MTPRGSGDPARPAAVPPSRRSHAPTVVAGSSGDAVKSPMQATIVKVAVEDGQPIVDSDSRCDRVANDWNTCRKAMLVKIIVCHSG